MLNIDWTSLRRLAAGDSDGDGDRPQNDTFVVTSYTTTTSCKVPTWRQQSHQTRCRFGSKYQNSFL